MYVVTVLFEVAGEAATAFLERVRRQAADSLSREPACRRFDVCVDPAMPRRVFLYELYDDRAAFDAHLASGHFKAFDREVAAMVLAKRVETYALTSDGAG